MDTVAFLILLFFSFVLDFLYFDWELIYHGSRMPPGYFLKFIMNATAKSTVHMTAYIET